MPVIAIPLAYGRAQTSSVVAGQSLKATSNPLGAGCRPYPRNQFSHSVISVANLTDVRFIPKADIVQRDR
jgi:hypothetical protein